MALKKILIDQELARQSDRPLRHEFHSLRETPRSISSLAAPGTLPHHAFSR